MRLDNNKSNGNAAAQGPGPPAEGPGGPGPLDTQDTQKIYLSTPKTDDERSTFDVFT